MNYAKIIQLNSPPLDGPSRLYSSQPLRISAMPGPLEITRPILSGRLSNGVASAISGTETTTFGPGSYLSISHSSPVRTGASKRSEPALAIAEVVGAIALEHPGLLGPTVYEGSVVDGQELIRLPEGPPSRSTPQALDLPNFSAFLQKALGDLEDMSPGDRERFKLASRWYVRGLETLNPVDKFLYWYMALEVYPAAGEEVGGRVRDTIHREVYPEIPAGEIKRRIGISSIGSQREEIVHRGLSFVDLPTHPQFDLALQQLSEIVVVCLRLLAGRPPGQGLDKWVRS